MNELEIVDEKLKLVLSDVKKSIQEIDDIDEILKIRAAAGGFEEAWKKYYKTSGFGFEQMFAGWEVKIRSEKRMGEMLADMPKQEGYRTPTGLQSETPLLEDLGISKTQSHRYQQLSQIDDDKFDKKIEELRGSFKEPTTAEVMLLYKAKQKDTKKKEYEEKAKDFKSEDIKIVEEDFRKVDLAENSIDLIITDPPYPKEFLPLWQDMFDQASRILKPSKFLVCYANHQNLDKIFQMKHDLIYYWTFKLDFTLKPIAMGRNLIATWKPVLIFQKPPFKKIQETIEDNVKEYTDFKQDEREMHDDNWGQSVGKFEYLIDKFSAPNDLIFEPFAGTGTTLIAAKNMKRRCVGAEIDHKYIDLIKGRLNE